MLLATGAGGDGVPGAGVAGTPTGSEAAPPPDRPPRHDNSTGRVNDAADGMIPAASV
jgi:hypothetical protein